MTAVVVVRTLSGGLERNIDWVLIDKIFEDDLAPKVANACWARVLQKNRLHVEKMQADFQEIFLQAYESNSIPSLDYDNLKEYDWPWLVDWAQQQLEMPDAKVLPGLPASRRRLDGMYDMRLNKEPETEALFEFNSGTSIPKRLNIATMAPFTVPVRFNSDNATNAEDQAKLLVAKSWVRANVLTPEATYNPQQARDKLLSLGESLIERALKELLSERVIQQENRGRLIPGRNYDISALFVGALRKNLEVGHFRQAVAYKRSLDASFAAHGHATFSYHAHDGDVVALTNLAADRRVALRPRNPPAHPAGLIKGYMIRGMDKAKLQFDVDLSPTDTYVYGIPIFPLPAPPRGRLDLDPSAGIPAWIDIHGGPIALVWESVLSAVLALLVGRPGLGVAGLQKCLKPSVEAWEVRLIMEWLEALGVVGRTSQGLGWGAGDGKGSEGEGEWDGGYLLKEWWWACLG